MAQTSLANYLETAAEAARRGGAVLEQCRAHFAVREKGRFDLVTDADIAAQETVRDYLLQQHPDHGFLGEEDPTAGWESLASGRPTWIVDPLDGTTNYVHGHPAYAVSIGLAESGELLVGAIYDPNRNEMFLAARGSGAFLNGQPLKVSSVARLEEALLSTGFPPDLNGQERALADWHYFSLHTQSLRRTGSTALNLAYVAAGRHDGFWTCQAYAWDAAAGVVLIREAGGNVTQPNGAPYDLRIRQVLATNGPLHRIMMQGLRAAAK